MEFCDCLLHASHTHLMRYAKRTSFSYHHRHFHIIIIIIIYIIILSIVSSSGIDMFVSALTRLRASYFVWAPLFLCCCCSCAWQLDLSRRTRILYNVPTALHTRIHAPNKWNIKQMWGFHIVHNARTHAPQKPWVYFFHYQFNNCNLNESMDACVRCVSCQTIQSTTGFNI